MSATQDQASEAPTGVVRPKIVYVMGTARSGSTILGVALGNCADVFYAGELGGWLEKSGTPRLKGVERQEFWATVRQSVHSPDDLFGRDALLAIERSLSLIRIHMWGVRRRIRQRYRRVTEELYVAIARTAGATHVVDSSSYPLRARELKRLDGVIYPAGLALLQINGTDERVSVDHEPAFGFRVSQTPSRSARLRPSRGLRRESGARRE
jgi:hypothetical protein